MNLGMSSHEILTAELVPIGLKLTATEGEPFESELVVYQDSVSEAGIWEITPGAFPAAKVGSWEYMHFVGGAGTIEDDAGHVIEIRPGVACFLPDGWTGTWTVTESVRKTYVIASVRGNV